jgi:hypothetical protein
MRCPGTDTMFWTSSDIFEIKCPNCGSTIEFFKDDSSRKCSGCEEVFFNPRKRTDCLQYCKFADSCKELLNKVL